jgi:aminoglycoside 6'-N-acetyltransferase I
MTSPQLNVRPISEDDLSEWFRLRRKLWDATSDDDHKAEMLEILDHPESQLVLVADAEPGKLSGFLEASIRPFVEDCESDNVGYLEGWFVDTEFRRRGIGRALVQSAEMWARERGCTEMASDAELGNDPSIASHIRLGYQETSRLVHLRKSLE